MALPEILIVSGDAILRDWMAVALENAGFHVSTASNHREACLAYQREVPGLLILDQVLPGGSGLELVEALKAGPGLDPATILFVTGLGFREVVFQAVQAGINQILVKPFDVDTLIERIQKMSTANSPQPPGRP